MSAVLLSSPLAAPSEPTLGRVHARRLREVYRSAGWPCQDLIEIELLAAGLVARTAGPGGHETLRVTDAGIALLAATLQSNRAALSAHEALVGQVATEMLRAGRIAWRGLALRARIPCDEADTTQPTRWCMAKPDVFSIRNTSVEAYALPVVHEVKVRRADLLGDLRRPAKRAAYLDMASECWYVLGNDPKGSPIGAPDEIPADCGVMLVDGTRLTVARPAPRRARVVPFAVWMALAKATPIRLPDGDGQALLGGPP